MMWTRHLMTSGMKRRQHRHHLPEESRLQPVSALRLEAQYPRCEHHGPQIDQLFCPMLFLLMLQVDGAVGVEVAAAVSVPAPAPVGAQVESEAGAGAGAGAEVIHAADLAVMSPVLDASVGAAGAVAAIAQAVELFDLDLPHAIAVRAQDEAAAAVIAEEINDLVINQTMSTGSSPNMVDPDPAPSMAQESGLVTARAADQTPLD